MCVFFFKHTFYFPFIFLLQLWLSTVLHFYVSFYFVPVFSLLLYIYIKTYINLLKYIFI